MSVVGGWVVHVGANEYVLTSYQLCVNANEIFFSNFNALGNIIVHIVPSIL